MSRFSAHAPAVAISLVEDDRIRVVRWDFEPGAETGWHTHGLAYVVVPITDLPMLVVDKEGERRVDVARGAVYQREAGAEHNIVNDGRKPMSFIEIEFKR
jgi:quercetin dioxygenase-like cupin family protein